jgi:multidrug efflux pump subunit AcrA (membrane-fusion protein)
LIAKLHNGERTTEIRTPVTGRIRSLSVATGATVAAGSEVAAIDPSSEQVWEALRALYLVGQLGDLPAIRAYERAIPEIPDRLRQQALLTEKAIQARQP